jgi:hypothetical protein
LEKSKRVKSIFLPPRYELGFPLLEVQLAERELGFSAYDLVGRLKRGAPPIHLGERKVMDGSVLIHPANLDEAAADVVLERLLAALKP